MLRVHIGTEDINISKKLFQKYNPNLFKSNADNITLECDLNIFKLIHDFIQGKDISNKIDSYRTWHEIREFLVQYHLVPLFEKLLESLPFYIIQIGYKDFKICKKLLSFNNGLQFDWIGNSCVPELSSTVFEQLHELLIQSEFQTKIDLPILTTTDIHNRDILIEYCQYFKFFKLKQQLIKHEIVVNPYDDNLPEIHIRLSSLENSGITLKHGFNQVSNECTRSCNRENATASENSNSQSNSSSDNDDNDAADNPQPRKKKQRTNCKAKKSWDIIKYSRPYQIDPAPNELVFQLDEKECSLVFNKSSKSIHIDMVGETLKIFENKFSNIFRNEGIDLNKFKCRYKKQSGGREFDHLVLPACIPICDLTINSVPCRNIAQFINESTQMERIVDFSNMDELTFSYGFVLNLNKSMWKCGIKDGMIMMIAIKAEALTNIKEFNKTTQFI